MRTKIIDNFGKQIFIMAQTSKTLVAHQEQFQTQSLSKDIISWICKLTDSGIESERESDLEDEPQDEGTFEKDFQEKCSCSHTLEHEFLSKSNEKVKSSKQEEKLKRVKQSTKNLEPVLTATIKERDFFKLKCHQLEQQVAILEEAKKARLDESPMKSSTTRNADLQKIGLTEDILLALPFGYTTKIRSTFEKLTYDNEKLCSDNSNLACKNERLEKSIGQLLDDHKSTQEVAARSLHELTKHNQELRGRLESVSIERRAVSESLEKAREQIQEHLKSSQNLHQVMAMMNAELQQLRRLKQTSETPVRTSLENELEELKRNCSLLSQINTSMLLNNRR